MAMTIKATRQVIEDGNGLITTVTPLMRSLVHLSCPAGPRLPCNRGTGLFVTGATDANELHD
jgi:hypothetical protein